MTTEATSAQNTYISTGDGASPEVFTEIAEVVSIGGPNETAEELDATHLRSAGGYREFIPSFKDGGEVPLEMNFIPGNATQQALQSEFASGVTKNRRITFPDGTTCTFAAWVKTSGTPGVSVGSVLRKGYTLRIVGPTYWDFAA